MRKLFATLALCLVLFGTFSPLSFSVGNGLKNNIIAKQSVFAQTQGNSITTTTTSNGTTTTTTEPGLSRGDIESQVNNATVEGCVIADLVCHIFSLIIDFLLFIPNLIMVVAGLFMDISLELSITPGAYGISGSSIETGLRVAWSIVRDFANIGFIFALFVAAFSLILGKDIMGFKPKETVVRVVIMALLVNFSFFFCRIIIQTADVFSHFLYSKISIDADGPGISLDNISTGSLLDSVGYKSPSFAIVSQVNPQSILLRNNLINGENTNVGKAVSTAIGTSFGGYYGGWSGAAIGFTAGALGAFNFKTATYYVLYGAVAIISFIIYMVLIITFASIAILFLGRIFGLWIGIIISPIAFVSYSIPFIADNPYFGFNKWLENFVKLAVTTPIFIFFLYIAVSILKIKELVPEVMRSGGGGIIVDLLATLLPALAAMFILMKGKKIAMDMGGDIGAMAGKVGGIIGGLAVGASLGGTALMARQGLGRGGAWLANKYADDSSATGRHLNTLGKGLATSTYDVRNSKFAAAGLGAAIGGITGEKIDISDFGKQKKGGFNESGGFQQMYGDWKEKREDEKARQLEEEAKERANNPQSPENIRKRNAERRKKKAEEAKKAEEQRIAMEAENATVDEAVDAVNAEVAERNARIAEIDAQIANNGGPVTEASEQAVRQQKTDADTQVANLQQQITQLEQTITANSTGGAAQAARKEEAEQQKAQFEQQLVVAIADQAQKAQAVTDVEAQKAANETLERDKTDLQTKQTEAQTTLAAYAQHLGKTVGQMKQEIATTRITAMDSEEGRALSKAEGEVKKKEKELNDLTEKKKELRREGKNAEAQALEAEINKLKNNNEEGKLGLKQLRDKVKAAKDVFEEASGIKELDGLVKKSKEAYTKSQDFRLDPLKEEIKLSELELTEANNALDQRQSAILAAHAQGIDNRAQLTGRIANAVANPVMGITADKVESVLGVIGMTTSDAANRATAKVREAAIDRKKNPIPKPPPKDDKKGGGDKKSGDNQNKGGDKK
jgi:hypothetical protein